MDINKSFQYQNGSRLKIVFSFLLVFIVAFTSIGSFSFLANMDIDKIEKLAEGENEIDIEEKEKNLEVEEDSFLNSYYDKFNSSENGLQKGQNHDQRSLPFLKISTPPPDYI